MKSTGWKPILSHKEVPEAFAVIEAIAAAITRNQTDFSLAAGSAGLAILYAYLDQARSGCGDEETARQFLKHAMDAASNLPMGPSLYEGLTGITWVIAHLRGSFLEADDDATEEVDTLLRDYLSCRPWPGHYDLIGGLVGFGVYALEQLPGSLAIESLRQVIARLDEIAETTADWLTWLTPPNLLPDEQRKLCPNGYYNLGVAHGVPGVIAFLAHVSSVDPEGMPNGLGAIQTKAAHLLEGAVSWLLMQKNADTERCVFQSWIGPGLGPAPSRVAWCYGDLGITMALLLAARSLGEASWEREALWLARRVAERSHEHWGIKDGGLCHGAAGVGHIFNRLFQASGEPWLKEVAQSWFKRTLEMRRWDDGVAGFSALEADARVAREGFLTGAAGIALALLAAVTPIEPAWDRTLLLSAHSGPRLRSD
jgi:lantibiotic modifying enzyme